MTQETLRIPSQQPAFRVIATQEARIRELSQRAAQVAQPAFRELERRCQQRVPYARLITLTPLNDQQLDPSGEPVYVVGKHLSPLGLDFFHHDPIPQRYAIASLETGPDHWLHFLTTITWCRFLKSNWYDSGGRFMKVVEWNDERYMQRLRDPLGPIET